MTIQYRFSVAKLNEYLSEGKNKTVFTAAITVLLLVSMFLIGIVPAYSSLRQQGIDNKKRDEFIAEQKKKLSELRNLSEDVSTNADLVSFLDELVPDKIDQGLLVNFFADQANSVNTTLMEIEFSKAIDPNLLLANNIVIPANSDLLSVNLLFHGQRSNLLSLLRVMENSRRILNLVTVQISKKTEADTIGTGEYIANINLLLYYWKKI